MCFNFLGKKPEKRRNSTDLKIPLNKKIKAGVIDVSPNKNNNNNNSKDISEIIGPVEDQENHVGSNIDDKNAEDKNNESTTKISDLRNNSDPGIKNLYKLNKFYNLLLEDKSYI